MKKEKKSPKEGEKVTLIFAICAGRAEER